MVTHDSSPKIVLTATVTHTVTHTVTRGIFEI